MARVPARSHPNQARSLVSGLLAVSRKDRADRRPASMARELLTCWLCTKMWMTCAQRH